MTRYTNEAAFKLALRVPKTGARSWDDGLHDSLIADCIEQAETIVDDLCPGWSPFDALAIDETRSFYADGAAAFGILNTDPFTISPAVSSIQMGGLVIAMPTYRPFHEIVHAGATVTRPGKSLVTITGAWTKGARYDVTTTWGWGGRVPAAVKNASIRAAVMIFTQTRSQHGVLEIGEGAMYEPRDDSVLLRWLAPYLGGEAE